MNIPTTIGSVDEDKKFDKKGVIRKMSHLERAFYQIPGLKVTMVVRLEGKVDPVSLQTAIDRIPQKHPLLGAKVVFDADHTAWFSTEEVEKPMLSTMKRTSSAQWFSEFQKMQAEMFEPQRYPMADYRLLYDEKGADLIVMVSHVITDGTAMVFLLRDLLNLYADPQLKLEQVIPLPMSDYMALTRPSFTNWLTKRYASKYNKQWRCSPHSFDQPDYKAINNAFWKKYTYGSVFLELKGQQLNLLQQKCHNHEVSVGAAIAVAFLAAHEEQQGAFTGNKRVISIPFDLRRHATRPVGDLFSLCVGTFMFPFRYKTKRSFWGNARELNKLVKKNMKRMNSAYMELEYFDATLLDAFNVFAYPVVKRWDLINHTENLKRFSQDTKNPAFKVVKSYEDKVPGTLFSNVGRVSIPNTYGDLKISRLALPSVINENTNMLLVGATISNHLVFTMAFAEEVDNREQPLTKQFINIRNRALELLGFPETMSPDPFL
ncbi:hypothetical protein [Mariniphaga sediminis]|uniref:hypothetical protein n=1 Tax=Mariniphaga sediminis TaxID=1628158 RepID=UPI00356745CC